MPDITEEQVRDRLATVNDPELNEDLVSLGMVKNIAIEGSAVHVEVELTSPACPLKERIKQDVEQAVAALDGVERVDVKLSARVRSNRPDATVLPGVKNVVAIGAGKGGVGKSTAAVLIAYGLAESGARVGLMDADVYGPSIPRMTNTEGGRIGVRDELMVPVTAAGVKIMSIGFMLDPGKPVIWRGPMTHGIVKQFLEQVDWGELDYLIVDLPPGTGDVPLSLAQSIPVTGAIVICTPQDIAMMDARRAIGMYEQLNVPCLGIIENMSFYICPQCGHRDELFDHGGARVAAEQLKVPFLGEIPLNAQIRVHGDGGTPEKVFTEASGGVGEAVQKVVANVAGQISVHGHRDPASASTCSGT